MATAEKGVKQQIAFYGSTPAYRGVLELHGWGDLQTELNQLSKQGEWVKMGELIDDDILRTFAVVAEPEGVGAELKRRYGGVVDRCSFYAPVQDRPRPLASSHRRPQVRVSDSSRATRGSCECTTSGLVEGRSGRVLPSPVVHRAGAARPAARRAVARHPSTSRHTRPTRPIGSRVTRSTRRGSVPSRTRCASTSGRHFSSNTPSAASRKPYSTYARNDSGVMTSSGGFDA